MKLGEKLQQLRKQSGLSQEQLAAQLTVSRQAVSKWELDETMPDTENVVQLSRIFGVSCDYLLRDEVDEQGAPVQPAAPGETHLDERGWTHNAIALALFVCVVGLLEACISWWYRQSTVTLFVALMIQVTGLMLFELASPRMGEGRKNAHFTFYMIANWLVLPIPVYLLARFLDYYVVNIPHLYWDAACVSCWLLFSTTVTLALYFVRRRGKK